VSKKAARKNSKQQRVAQAGIDALGGSVSPEFGNLIFAIAAMLIENDRKPSASKATSKANSVDQPDILYTEKDVLMLFDPPMEAARYGRLMRVIKTVKQQPDDLAQFKAWLESSMLPWAKANGVAITYTMLCNKFIAWLERARLTEVKTQEATTNKWR